MSEQLYTIADVAKATGRPNATLQQAMQKADVGHICGTCRILTDYEYRELCRLDRMAKEQKMDFGPLVVGCFSNRKAAFPYSTVDQVADFSKTTKTTINRWIGNGLLQAIKVGPDTRAVFLLDQDNQVKAKRLADENRSRMKPHQFKAPAEHIAIDPSMLKFSITREGAKQLLAYLKQQLGEN